MYDILLSSSYHLYMSARIRDFPFGRRPIRERGPFNRNDVVPRFPRLKKQYAISPKTTTTTSKQRTQFSDILLYLHIYIYIFVYTFLLFFSPIPFWECSLRTVLYICTKRACILYYTYTIRIPYTRIRACVLCTYRTHLYIYTLVIVNRAQFNLTNMANPPGGCIVQLNTVFFLFHFLTRYIYI